MYPRAGSAACQRRAGHPANKAPGYGPALAAAGIQDGSGKREPPGPATEPENTVLTDKARLVRWTGPAYALFSVLLLPWAIHLAVSLPSRQISPDYDTAWVGFDVILLAALAGTAWFALRRSRYLSAATAVLLIVDAWFDVITTPSCQRPESIVLAAAGIGCLWLSYHTQQLAQRRVVPLLRRQRGARRRADTPDHDPAGHDHGSSILLRGDQLPCHQ